jgi:hypothetical protein
MAFSDPQSVTISGSAATMPRISSGVNTGAFQTADGGVKMTIAHASNRSRARRTLRLDYRALVPDVINPEVNRITTASVYVVVNVPEDGSMPLATQKGLVDALVAYLTASSGARVTQLLGGEN